MNNEIQPLIKGILSVISHVQYPLALKALAHCAAMLIMSNGGVRGNGYRIFNDSLDLAMADIVNPNRKR